MQNPFEVDRPVTGDDLCGREPALVRLVEEALEDRPAAATGRRGSGLTSVARELTRRLRARGRLVLLLDAAAVSSTGEVASLALEEAERAGEAPQSPRPRNDGVDEESALARLARLDPERPVHLVVDDPGRRGGVAGLEELAGAARAAGLGLTVLARRRALGEGPASSVGGLVQLGPVAEAAWLPYVLERFLRTERWIGNDHVRWAVEATGGGARHTQLLFHFLWEEAGPEGRVDVRATGRAHRDLLARAGGRFELLLDSLTANQRRLLYGLARADPPVQPYAADFVRRHGLASPSSVQRALSSLREAGLVEEGDGGPGPADPVLGRWLRRPRIERFEPEDPTG